MKIVISEVSDMAAKKPESSLGYRHLVIFLLFLATTVSYATRVSMSVAIVAMTTKNQTENDHMTIEPSADWGVPCSVILSVNSVLSTLYMSGIKAVCYLGTKEELTKTVFGRNLAPKMDRTADGGVFDWDRKIQDTILSSFFWGYIVLQIPAGMLANKFGGKLLVFVSMIITGLVNLFVPLAAEHGGWIAVCACRIIMGLFQGILYPSVHGILGHWAPVTERSRMGTFVYAGSQLGTIVEMMLAGILSASAWGWPSVYYVAGVSCLAWAAIWIVFGDSTPGTSRWISKEERKYIETSAGSTDIGQHRNMSTPWKSIMTSLPFWAIIIAHSGQSLGFWTLLTEMPSYMAKVLDVDIKNSGFLSSLPYVAMYLLSFVFSWLADFLVNGGYLKLGTSRRIFNTIAFWGPAAALIALAYLPAGHLTLAVAILTITVGLNGAHYVGFLISHIDLSPNFSSTLMGITNGCGNIFSIMAPLSVTAVVRDETSASEWRKVFFISIGFYFLSNLFYLLFSSGEVQPWNEPNASSKLEEGSKKRTSRSSKNASVGEERF